MVPVPVVTDRTTHLSKPQPKDEERSPQDRQLDSHLCDNKAYHPSTSASVFCDLSTLSKSPIDLHTLEHCLYDYPHQKVASALLQGFRYGFHLEYSGNRQGRLARNHKSARDKPAIVWQKLLKEISLGRIAGPFKHPPFEQLIVSPTGLVPKKTPAEYRLIFYLSYP